MALRIDVNDYFPKDVTLGLIASTGTRQDQFQDGHRLGFSATVGTPSVLDTEPPAFTPETAHRPRVPAPNLSHSQTGFPRVIGSCRTVGPLRLAGDAPGRKYRRRRGPMRVHGQSGRRVADIIDLGAAGSSPHRQEILRWTWRDLKSR